jgi:hypothetical protein
MSTQAAPRRITRITFLVSLAVLLFSFIASSGGQPAAAPHLQSEPPDHHCTPVGGTVMTNLGVVDQSTTLGVVDGDLKGAVAATILNVVPGSGGTTIFTVQHHFVTQAGDTILVDQATATTKEVVPGSGLYAILNYPVHINGGTGRFAGATGDFNNIGAADLGTGRTVFRYSGQVCFAAQGND